MRRLFILEGPDKSGKTTLGKWLARELNAAYFHLTGTRNLRAGMQDYHEEELKNVDVCLNVSQIPVVLDRCWMSEWCYGRALQRTDIDFDFDKLIRLTNPFIPTYIFCESDRSMDEQMVAKDHPYPKDDFTRIIGEYNMLYEILSLSPGTTTPLTTHINSVVKRHAVVKYSLQQHGADIRKFCTDRLLIPDERE